MDPSTVYSRTVGCSILFFSRELFHVVADDEEEEDDEMMTMTMEFGNTSSSSSTANTPHHSCSFALVALSLMRAMMLRRSTRWNTRWKMEEEDGEAELLC